MLLCPCVRRLWDQLREQATDKGIETVLIETLRDAERQSYYLAAGVSWTLRSKHLPQPPNGLALAFDAAPREVLHQKGWAPGANVWYELGEIGEDLGLEWGGTWVQRDYPHFQKSACSCKPPAVLSA